MNRTHHDTDLCMREAGDWLVRLDDATVTEADIRAWLDWCEADPRNRQMFEQAQATWELAREMTFTPPETQRLSLRLRLAHWATDWYQVNRPLLAFSLAGALVAAIFTLGLPQDRAVTEAPDLARAPVEPVVRETRLADGSAMKLAKGSKVSLRFTPTERRLELRSGEASFEVVKDHQRPFIVTVGRVRVTAVGTAFNVRQAADRIVVTVSEGIVDVARDSGAADSVRLAAGSQWTWDEPDDGPTLASVDPAATLSWQQGILSYDDEPLGAVIADFNRYAERPARIDHPAIAQLRFTGTIFTLDTREWLYALPRSLPVELRNERDYWQLILRDTAPSPLN